MTAVEFIN